MEKGDHHVVVVVVYLQRVWKWKRGRVGPAANETTHLAQTLFCPVSHVLEALVTRWRVEQDVVEENTRTRAYLFDS